MIDNKRGISMIVSTLLIVLLVIVAIGIIWGVFRGVFRQEKDWPSIKRIVGKLGRSPRRRR